MGCLVLLAVPVIHHHHVCRERACSRGITVGAVFPELLSGQQSTPEDLGTAMWSIWSSPCHCFILPVFSFEPYCSGIWQQPWKKLKDVPWQQLILHSPRTAHPGHMFSSPHPPRQKSTGEGWEVADSSHPCPAPCTDMDVFLAEPWEDFVWKCPRFYFSHNKSPKFPRPAYASTDSVQSYQLYCLLKCCFDRKYIPGLRTKLTALFWVSFSPFREL